MSMVTVASLPLGAALLDARQVMRWPLSMLDAETYSVLTVLSLWPSRSRVYEQIQQQRINVTHRRHGETA